MSQQLTSRDAALLTWAGLLLAIWFVLSLRAGRGAQGPLRIIRGFGDPWIVSMIALVAAWQLLVIFLAQLVGLWDLFLLKDTVVIVAAGSVMTGFKALALIDGDETWRGEVRSVLTLVVILQWVSNLHTFPYFVELLLVPLAILLGGAQALAHHNKEHEQARPVIDGMLVLLGLGILGWSLYRLLGSLGSTEWDEIGRSFALAFWLPAALLPAVYVAALVMGYGKVLSRIKVFR